ncbi:MAG: molybdopterin cofactor-binding domain-containing protein [Xanthobacteraceae bacterium]
MAFVVVFATSFPRMSAAFPGASRKHRVSRRLSLYRDSVGSASVAEDTSGNARAKIRWLETNFSQWNACISRMPCRHLGSTLAIRRAPIDRDGSAETVSTFPNGCHFAEVEIDPATGELTLISYTAVDDCGCALNHAVVEGQTHGALVQGLGQAMMERTIYDLADGQLTTGSFMDYAMPRASDMPSFRDAMHNVPATTNPLGVKGVGEAETTGAIATLMNAIADAIPGQAGACIDMPATPERLWRACRAAQDARRDAKRSNE